jgi:hypothetical protein
MKLFRRSPVGLKEKLTPDCEKVAVGISPTEKEIPFSNPVSVADAELH